MRAPVYLRGGIYWCRVSAPGGGRSRRISTRTTDRRAAIAEWRRLEQRAFSPSDRAANETTVERAVDAMLTERRSAGRAPGTVEMYEQKARHLERVFGPKTPLRAIDARAIDGYVAKRLEEGAARGTVHKELVTLRRTLRLARRHGAYAFDLEEVMPDFSVRYEPRTRRLSEADADRLLAEIAPQRRPVVAFLLATGASYPSEVANAVRGDVDARKGRVFIRGTKRESRRRTVHVPSYARRWLALALSAPDHRGKLFEPWPNVRRELADACRRLSMCPRCAEAARRWARHEGGPARKVEDCKACGRTAPFPRVSPNDLRRTFGSLLREHGVEPQLIAPQMGHRDSRMVERVYGRLPPEELARLVEERVAACTPGVPRPVDAGALRGRRR